MDRLQIKLMLLPIQEPLHCDDINKAKQIPYDLVKEGKLIEIEPGKYKPNPEKELSSCRDIYH
jgi:hypothetical protein